MNHAQIPERPEAALLCRVRGLLCALPLEYVEETMRPLAIERIAGVPSFLRGLAVVRASAVPVIDAAMLLGGDESRPTRFVTVKAGPRRIAIAVDAVVGVGTIPHSGLERLPLLFQGSDTEAITAIGSIDSELMIVLRSARLVPEHAWPAIDASVPA